MLTLRVNARLVGASVVRLGVHIVIPTRAVHADNRSVLEILETVGMF